MGGGGAEGSGMIESTDDREVSSVEEGSRILGRLRPSFDFIALFEFSIVWNAKRN